MLASTFSSVGDDGEHTSFSCAFIIKLKCCAVVDAIVVDVRPPTVRPSLPLPWKTKSAYGKTQLGGLAEFRTLE